MRWLVVRRCLSQERKWRLFSSEIGMGRSLGFGVWCLGCVLGRLVRADLGVDNTLPIHRATMACKMSSKLHINILEEELLAEHRCTRALPECSVQSRDKTFLQNLFDGLWIS